MRGGGGDKGCISWIEPCNSIAILSMKTLEEHCGCNQGKNIICTLTSWSNHVDVDKSLLSYILFIYLKVTIKHAN